jgi:hypothetical protein
MRPLALAAVLLLLLPGCSGPEAAGTATLPPTSTAPATTASGPGGGAGQARALADVTQELYLDTQMRLQATRPEAGDVPVPGGFDSSGQVQFLRFQGPPVAAPATLPGPTAQLTLFVRAELPVPSNQQFDLAAWLGTTRGMPLFDFATYPAAANLPGTFRLDLEFGWGSLAPPVLAAGDALQLAVAALGEMTGSGLRIVVGGEQASFLRLRSVELPEDPLGKATPSEERLTGHVTGMGLFDCSTVPELQRQALQVEVGANATWLAILLEPAATADLDMYLGDGGATVSQATTPSGQEMLFVAGPAAAALRGKSLELVVLGCSGGPVDYAAVVRQA